MGKTNIGYVDFSLNPYWWRCRKTSPGCANCYMFALANRRNGADVAPGTKDPRGPFGTRWDKALAELRAMPAGAWVFVNDMSDTYYELAPDADVMRCHWLAVDNPDKTFLIVTKRPERAYHMRERLPWPDNLWLIVSVENGDYLWRVHFALWTGAAHVGVSAEPLLGPLDGLRGYLQPEPYAGVDFRWRRVEWVIAGGESGAGRRPMQKNWARALRDMCLLADVPFFYKQGNAFKPGQDRLLDGRTWDERPGVAVAAPGVPRQLALL